jgi:hypothetical protein
MRPRAFDPATVARGGVEDRVVLGQGQRGRNTTTTSKSPSVIRARDLDPAQLTPAETVAWRLGGWSSDDGASWWVTCALCGRPLWIKDAPVRVGAGYCLVAKCAHCPLTAIFNRLVKDQLVGYHAAARSLRLAGVDTSRHPGWATLVPWGARP